MFLLLEGGATKLYYVLADAQQVYTSGRIAGVHPFLSGAASWQQSLEGIRSNLDDFPSPHYCYYYGTGCGTRQGQEQVRTHFHNYWPTVGELRVADDLSAAAHSLCGQQGGLVGILGTGSNAAYYDGQRIVAQAGGLGYLLGDEGGGASLGRALLRAFFQERLPAELRKDLLHEHPLERDTLLPALYHGEAPSRLLASFAPWLHRQRAHPFIQELLRDDFRSFLTSYMVPLARQFTPLQMALTGSIAANFADLLKQLSQELDLPLPRVEADPAAGLLAYHQELAGRTLS